MNFEHQFAVPSPVTPPIDFAERIQTSARSRVLIIEDDILIGMLFSETLMSMGYIVCGVAVDEREAVEAARIYEPDLMIVDARLCQGGAVAAVNNIITHAFIPHVFATGDKTGVLDLKPDAIIIEKPFNDRELITAIKLAMSMARTQN